MPILCRFLKMAQPLCVPRQQQVDEPPIKSVIRRILLVLVLAGGLTAYFSVVMVPLDWLLLNVETQLDRYPDKSRGYCVPGRLHNLPGRSGVVRPGMSPCEF